MKSLPAASVAVPVGAVLDAAPDAMVVVGPKGTILAANIHTLMLFGYAAEDLIGQPIEALVPAGFRERHVRHHEHYIADPHRRPMGGGLDLRGRRRDGSEFPVEISLSPLETEEGRLTIAAIRDNSERRKSIEAKFQVLLEAAPDPMIVTDSDGHIRLINGRTERLFGYVREELLGQPIEMLVPPHAPVGAAAVELYGRRKDGTEFPVETSLSPLETDEGMLTSVRDISDRKRLEENIQLQNQALEAQNHRVQEASRMKSEFLANMSHELRTPLNSIIGFAEMMRDEHLGPVAENHREYLGDILTSGRQLLSVINDVLDLSKVESGTMEFFVEPVDIQALTLETRDMVRFLAADKRIQIEIRVDPNLTGVVGDSMKLKQVISNYLSNAVKYTSEGGRIDVRVNAEGSTEFRIEVQDTGVGIRPEDVGRLFVEFQQLDSSPAKKHQGTGLGLALTKRLVEAQGGRVGVSSTFGSGSLFFAVLPREGHRKSSTVEALSSGTAVFHSSPVTGDTVMIIDDDPAALKLVGAALRQRGYRPVCTDSTITALANLGESHVDLLVLDLEVPVLSGEVFLERFRAIPSCALTPVIIWTVKDLSPGERAQLLAHAQAIVLKRHGGITGLLDCISRFLVPSAAGATGRPS